MSLLSVVTSVSRRVGIGVPTTVVGATDDATLQLLDLAQEGVEDICHRHGWQRLRSFQSFTTSAQIQQIGSLPADYDRMAQGMTMWDVSSRLPVAGPALPDSWASLQVLGVSTALNMTYRLLGGSVALYPIPAAGHTITFEYISSYGVVDASGVAKQAFTADTDTTRFPEGLLLRDLRWRWKAAKGLDYAEERAVFEEAFERAVGSDYGSGPGIATGLTPHSDGIVDNTLNGNIAPSTVVVAGALE